MTGGEGVGRAIEVSMMYRRYRMQDHYLKEENIVFKFSLLELGLKINAYAHKQ